MKEYPEIYSYAGFNNTKMINPQASSNHIIDQNHQMDADICWRPAPVLGLDNAVKCGTAILSKCAIALNGHRGRGSSGPNQIG
jgi:hypothetical protein